MNGGEGGSSIFVGPIDDFRKCYLLGALWSLMMEERKIKAYPVTRNRVLFLTLKGFF